MFPVKEPPYRLFEELRKSDEISFVDSENKIVPFLKEQFEYESQRKPIHPSFLETYCSKQLDFNPALMLMYYMDPCGQNPNVEYLIIENDPISRYPTIYKRTKNPK